MKKLILIPFAALALASCAMTGTSTQLPAPLQHTVIDDRGVRFGFQTLDALASLAEQAVDAKLITPGTVQAKAIASGLDATRHALNAASAAQKAGSVTEYNEAFAQASVAMAQVKAALAALK